MYTILESVVSESQTSVLNPLNNLLLPAHWTLVFFKHCPDVSQEESDVRLAIQEALSMMVGAYTNLQGALLNLMEALVAAYIVKVGRPAQSRSVVKCENQVFSLVIHSLIGKS